MKVTISAGLEVDASPINDHELGVVFLMHKGMSCLACATTDCMEDLFASSPHFDAGKSTAGLMVVVFWCRYSRY